MSEQQGSFVTRPAGLFRRLAALLYDALLLFAVVSLATLLVLPLSGGEAFTPNHPIYRSYILFVAFFYFAWQWVRGGQTLGMRTWRLRVVQEDGAPLTWWHALLRFMLAIPSLLLGGLGFLWMLVDKDKLMWHDRGSGTKVVAEIPVKPRKGAGDS